MKAAALAFAGVVALAWVQAGTGAEQASRIVDRTLLCRMTGVGYPDPVRILKASASTQLPESAFPAHLALTNGAAGSGTGFTVTTGIKDQSYKSYVAWNRTTCSASKLRVPLSRKSLAGGAVRFGEGYDCDVAAQVLVRIQAVFQRRPRVAPDRSVRGELVYGYLAVATLRDRKPVVFASITGEGQSKIFVAPSRCQEG